MPDPRVRDLRQNPTDAEILRSAHLRLRQVHGHKFRPRGSYIFPRLRGKVRACPEPVEGMGVCLEERLIIEVDGSQHLEGANARWDDYLESLGFRVLRFWDIQVLNETDAIIEVIAQGEGRSAPIPQSS